MSRSQIIELGKGFWRDDRPELPSVNTKIEVKRPKRSFKNTEFMTVKELAAKLRLSYGRTCTLCRSGELDVQPMKKGYLISVAAVEEYLDGLKAQKRVS